MFSVTIDNTTGSRETMHVCKTRAIGIDCEHRTTGINATVLRRPVQGVTR